ncbi:MAG: septum formation initiator family protein [Actinobacteria bacterium]|nr:septum formation initiator family protein [Actinomycetota bacterium]MCA1722077.1 septum formation initiator family protein [Actinomycetota bacterium]
MAASRRPDSSRRRAIRVASRASVRPTPQPEPSRKAAGLTTRAAVLGLVVCALLMSAALPLREFLGQRGQIRELQQAQSAAAARVRALEEQKARLEDPSYVAALARDRLHFVRPGEYAYVVIAPSAPPVAPKDAQRAAAAPSGPEAPWYSQVWGSVRSADRPVQVRARR